MSDVGDLISRISGATAITLTSLSVMCTSFRKIRNELQKGNNKKSTNGTLVLCLVFCVFIIIVSGFAVFIVVANSDDVLNFMNATSSMLA